MIKNFILRRCGQRYGVTKGVDRICKGVTEWIEKERLSKAFKQKLWFCSNFDFSYWAGNLHLTTNTP